MQHCSRVFFTTSMVYRKAKSKALVKRDARWTLVFHDWNYNRFDTSMLGAKVTFLTMDSEQCCIILRMNGKILFYLESCFVPVRHCNLLKWLKHFLYFEGSSCSCSTLQSSQMIETFVKESAQMISQTFVGLSNLRANPFNCDLANDATPPAR